MKKLLLLGSCLWSLWAVPARGQAPGPLPFDSLRTDAAIRFAYPDTAHDPLLRQLRTEHGLNALLRTAPSTQAKALLVSRWVHGLWRHSGSNEPSRPDALTIIREAQTGKNFRCVEYARVTTDALLAVGTTARVLALKTADCATRKSGAGHVLTEVWLPEQRKWALLDAQFDLMPTLDGRPLNAVELQAAWARQLPVTFVSADGPVPAGRQQAYRRFLARYLHFFDVTFDQRPSATGETLRVASRSGLLLVPRGTAVPAVFQRRFPLDYLLPTSSVADFYPAPTD